MTASLGFVDLGFAALGVYFLKQFLRTHNKPAAPLPPGPPGLPLVGNIADMPKEKDWETFALWSKRYGDLMSVTILGQPIIILGSAEKAGALLEKKSAIYSDRPTLVMAGELVGWRQTLALTPYGSRFRSIRTMLHRLMGNRAAMADFTPAVELEMHRLLRRIHASPGTVAESLRKTAGAIILRISHGYQVKEHDDPIVACVDHATEQFSAATAPGAFLVDVLPFLRHIPEWFPGATFQRKAAAWRKTLQDMADAPHEYVKQQLRAGTAIPNFTANLIKKKMLSAEEEDTIKWAAASLYSGGADTTVSANYVFFLAMTLHPEVQKTAQNEIDEVVGDDRLPNLADRPNLPYVDALVKEVFRWQPTVPLGVPHRLTEDDVHDGYLIPKGSLVIANIWQMLHNEEHYADPMAFKPERFLSSTTQTAERDPRSICFGFGRRVCPGVNLADTSVWLACAMSLSAFNITKARAADGSEVTPLPEMTSGTISHPKPFECSIQPRSERHVAMITGGGFAYA